VVRSVAKKQELVANPSIWDDIPLESALPAPTISTSISIPQNTPKAVSTLRDLLCVMVIHISCHLSKSTLIY